MRYEISYNICKSKYSLYMIDAGIYHRCNMVIIMLSTTLMCTSRIISKGYMLDIRAYLVEEPTIFGSKRGENRERVQPY